MPEWSGVTIGMTCDDLIKIHPNTEWIKRPTIFRTGEYHKNIETLIVTYHYSGADITLELAITEDRLFGTTYAYAVQKIEVREDGSIRQPFSDKSKDRRKQRRQAC